MSQVQTAASGSVTAVLNYLAPMAEKPRAYTFEPPPGVPWRNGRVDERRVAIANARPLLGAATLDREGFAFARHETTVDDLYDETRLRAVYYPEVEALVRAATGAARVIAFDHNLRNGASIGAGLTKEPVKRVHNDFSSRSALRRATDELALRGEPASLLEPRFALVNLWRPVRGPVESSPLAVCDARSIAAGDLVPSDLVYRDRVGETLSITFNPAHRWWYLPAMRADEVLLIKCFDSAADGTARIAAHSAFDDPGTPADARPRESIEVRTLVLFAAA